MALTIVAVQIKANDMYKVRNFKGIFCPKITKKLYKYGIWKILNFENVKFFFNKLEFFV